MSDYALCPFYEFEKNCTLHCEHGVVKFPQRQDRNMWMRMHCNTWDFKMCKFYGELMKKYDTDN